MNPNDIPTDTAAQMERRQKFFAGAGNPNTHLPTYQKIGEQLKAEGFAVGLLPIFPPVELFYRSVFF